MWNQKISEFWWDFFQFSFLVSCERIRGRSSMLYWLFVADKVDGMASEKPGQEVAALRNYDK